MDSVLRGLFDLQPSRESIAKLVAEIRDLRPHYWVGMTLLQ
jgi:hypothetical protein